MGSIATWLKSDRDYWAGLQLLQENGGSEFIVELLQDGPDEYNTPKLVQELTALQVAGITIETLADQGGYLLDSREASNQFANAIGIEILDSVVTYTPDPHLEKTIRIKEQIKTLYKDIAHLKPQTYGCPEGVKLFDLAKMITIKSLKKQDLWEHLHYFEQNAKWFDELPENQVKPFDLEQEIKNVLANRSKVRKFLKSPLTAAKRTYYKQKEAELTAEIDKLKLQRT